MHDFTELHQRFELFWFQHIRRCPIYGIWQLFNPGWRSKAPTLQMIAVCLKDYLQLLVWLQYCGKQYPLVLRYPTAEWSVSNQFLRLLSHLYLLRKLAKKINLSFTCNWFCIQMYCITSPFFKMPCNSAILIGLNSYFSLREKVKGRQGTIAQSVLT